MRFAVKTTGKTKEAPKTAKRIGSRQFDADVTFSFIQNGQRLRHVVNVAVPASNMLGALGRAGRLAMPKLRDEFPGSKIKLKEITVEIAQAV